MMLKYLHTTSRLLLAVFVLLTLSANTVLAEKMNASIYAYLQNDVYTECLAEVNYNSFESVTEAVNYIYYNCYHPAFEQINIDEFDENPSELDAYTGIDPGFGPPLINFTPQSLYIDYTILFPDCMQGVSFEDFNASLGNGSTILSSYCESEFSVLFDDYLLNNTAPNPVGLSNTIQQGDIKVYPNPADDFIQIDLPQNITKGDIKIYSVSGALVVEEVIYENHTSIELNIPQGIYITEFLIEDKVVQSSKLIVKH